MKLLYSRFCCTLATLVLIISLNAPVKAQTTLAPGDLAFSGYKCNDAVPDQFSFVLLKAITAGTAIKFTDYGWRTDVLQFTNNGILESEITFTASSAIPAGREISIVSGIANATFTNGGIAGPIVYSVGANFLDGNLSLASNGDQVFAYQGSFEAPNFIAGIHMNVYTGYPSTTTATAWDGVLAASNQDNNNSGKPAALTTGTNANWFTTEFDNVKFNCGSISVNTASQTLAALNSASVTPGNWTTANNSNPSGFNLPTGCTYMGLAPLPVNLENFTGKLNSNKTITLQWKTADQQDVHEFIVEGSSNGSDFRQLGIVAAGNTDSYSFIDMQPATGNNYYRLKTMDLTGKHAYSNVIVVSMKAGIRVMIYPNPVTDKLTIQQFGTLQSKTATLYNSQGNILQQIRMTSLQQTVNMEKYPPGAYILKMEDGTVFKVMKQ